LNFKNGPVVLIIAGSGPTDRNGNNPMMKNNSLQQLAFGLADAGIASVRYDKRGIAASAKAMKSEDDLRFEDYINDIREWINLLKKDTRFTKITVCGHSEGSLLGMIASKDKADKYISIAGPGKPANETLREQLENQPEQVKEIAFPILDSLSIGVTVSNPNPMLAALFRPSVQPYLISWFKYNPQIEIAKLNFPVLILQGDQDLQVTINDAELLSKANKNAQMHIINGMNHIFKIVPGNNKNENIKSYSNPTKPISTQLLEEIISFIKQ
jgi:pimeloyl-ACP methyl ester carboxylesterase